ncbi:VOC family protein [uncultured Enterococcus sp.]|uniref:VOC family protein n=1 Tax=uncultured Enterococcus sp. TaxID=167972 RepID=UPI002AA73D7B|nr:VOC family protein [uncultured Enterococcus sp.]
MTKSKIIPFLTFPSTAEEAMAFYEASFPNSKITRLVRYDENVPNASAEMVGKVLNGSLELQGQELYFMDMEPENAPAFSWATSLYMNCEAESEFDTIFNNLSKEGVVMMGPEPVLNFRKVTWVTDKYGVTWQLVWE